MKTLEELSKELEGIQANPRALGRFNVELAAYYSYYAAQLQPIKARKPQAWINIKCSDGDKVLSDKFTEMKWKITEDGQKETEYELIMKAIEKMQTSIRVDSFIYKNEMKNSQI